MAIDRRKSGTGVTESDTLYWSDSEDENDPVISEIIERGNLKGLLLSLERECFAIMAQAGLPTTHGSFAYDEDGTWFEVDHEHTWPRFSIANEIWPIAKARGYSIDSPEGFAARMLGDIVWARRSFENKTYDRAALCIFHLGSKWSSRRFKEGWEVAALAGKKALEGAASTRKGAMTAAERVAEVNRLRRELGYSVKQAIGAVADKEGVTDKAIEADLYPPRKKRP